MFPLSLLFPRVLYFLCPPASLFFHQLLNLGAPPPCSAPPPGRALSAGRVGAWYTVTPQEEGVEVAWQKEMVDKAEPKVSPHEAGVFTVGVGTDALRCGVIASAGADTRRHAEWPFFEDMGTEVGQPPTRRLHQPRKELWVAEVGVVVSCALGQHVSYPLHSCFG